MIFNATTHTTALKALLLVVPLLSYQAVWAEVKPKTTAQQASTQPSSSSPASTAVKSSSNNKPTASTKTSSIKPATSTKPSATKATSAASQPNRPTTLAEANNAQQVAGQTNIIATVDTPMVTNIVVWQDQEVNIPKSPLEFSSLKDSLTPTDRDRLNSEIRYTQILNQTSSRQQ
jgi:cytoskeletal protein RodZ